MSLHVTEFGLGLCAGVVTVEEFERSVPVRGGDSSPDFPAREVLKRMGLRADTIACSGGGAYYDLPTRSKGFEEQLCVRTIDTPGRVPRCSRCSVLRDMAFVGVLMIGTPPAPPVANGPGGGGSTTGEGDEGSPDGAA